MKKSYEGPKKYDSILITILFLLSLTFICGGQLLIEEEQKSTNNFIQHKDNSYSKQIEHNLYQYDSNKICNTAYCSKVQGSLETGDEGSFQGETSPVGMMDIIIVITGLAGVIIGIVSIIWHIVHFKLLHGRPAEIKIIVDIPVDREGRVICMKNDVVDGNIILFNEGQYGTVVFETSVKVKSENNNININNINKTFGLKPFESKMIPLKIHVNEMKCIVEEIIIEISYKFLQTSFMAHTTKVEKIKEEKIILEVVE